MARARSVKRAGAENAPVRSTKTGRGRSRRSGSNEVLQEQDVNSPVRLQRERDHKAEDAECREPELPKKRPALPAVCEEASKRRRASNSTRLPRTGTNSTTSSSAAPESTSSRSSSVGATGGGSRSTEFGKTSQRSRRIGSAASDQSSAPSRRQLPSRSAKSDLFSLNQFHLEAIALATARQEAALRVKTKPKEASTSSSSSSSVSSKGGSVAGSENGERSKKSIKLEPDVNVAAQVLQSPPAKPVAPVPSIPERWRTMAYQGGFVNFSRPCRIANPCSNLSDLMDESRKQKVNLRIPDDEVYIVDKIVNHEPGAKGQIRFLVRWKDWSPKYDTWEPESNLVVSSANCLLLAEYFDKKKQRELSHQYLVKYLKSTVLQEDPEDLLLLATLAGHRLDPEHGPPIPFRKIRRQLQQRVRSNLSFGDQPALLKWFSGKLSNFTAFAKKRARGLDENQRWEMLIAKLEPNADITIENVFDAESLPNEFKYVTDYVVSPNVRYQAPKRSCRCSEKGCFGKDCCGVHAGRYRGYIRGQLARTCGQVPLYECNRFCRCGPNCENRLIQKGVQLSLTIFKTVSRGWGVRAEQRIARGTFVAEYLGELMTSAEAVSRHAVNFSYLFDLKPFRDRPVENTVDAAVYGNVSRFFNHSCDPNIAISYTYIENHYPGAPRLAFFARRDIARYEELTFNYCMQTTGTVGTLTKVECKCGSPKCRKYLF